MNCSDGISVQALRQRMQWMTQQIDELRELQERVRAAETKRSGAGLEIGQSASSSQPGAAQHLNRDPGMPCQGKRSCFKRRVLTMIGKPINSLLS